MMVQRCWETSGGRQHKKQGNRLVIAVEQSDQRLMVLFSHDRGWGMNRTERSVDVDMEGNVHRKVLSWKQVSNKNTKNEPVVGRNIFHRA